MNFTIITHVIHGEKDKTYFGYGPYIREMNIWLKHVDEVVVVAPLQTIKENAIHLSYEHENLRFRAIPAFSFISAKNALKSMLRLPGIILAIYSAMKAADHIHLRCPGNVGLIGCFVQILFPGKPKTAKYAGNWDPKAKQPLSYRLQKWMLSNTFLTKNMQVLVYGEWKGSTENIRPFFTATYTEKDKSAFDLEQNNSIKSSSQEAMKFLFVGSLTEGKRPIYAVQLVEALSEKGFNVRLDLMGEGVKRKEIEDYICMNKREGYISLKGNQNSETIRKAYQESHFLLLPSKSEGWPKVVAEAMFWGCVPAVTPISCVPYMVDSGERGIMLTMDLQKDAALLAKCIEDKSDYFSKAEKALLWSQKYTLDYFEEEVKGLLQK